LATREGKHSDDVKILPTGCRGLLTLRWIRQVLAFTLLLSILAGVLAGLFQRCDYAY